MKGEFLIRVDGVRLERLLKRAIDKGASFKKVTRTSPRTMIVEACASDANILLGLCRRYSIPAKVIETRGRSRIYEKIRSRATLLPGLLTGVILCALLLSRLWFIDITFTGPQAQFGDRAAFERILEDLSIKPGMSGDIDASLLSGTLEAGIEGYSYISAKVQGVRLLIEAAPEVPAPDVYDLAYARDLYSAFDGVVESIEVHSGVACVQTGDVVRRGQLLIRGEERQTKEENRSISALGKVIVRTWYEGRSSGLLTEIRNIPTGKTSSFSNLRILDFSFPLSGGIYFESAQVREDRLPIGGMFIPVEIVREEHAETKAVPINVDREALSDRLAALAMADAAIKITSSGPDEFNIARSWLRYDITDAGMLEACAVYEIFTNAAVTRGALLQGG
ncbi:MAG: hypothetical protein E7337_04625 [Clostridiales bacterium]|nr:hypothetical protein [Clostridiales bacterium]